jgi:large subunit ribosomal protein L28
MSKVCQLTGKRPISGHHVSHSNRKTKRRFLPNLQKKRFYIPETDEWITLRVTTKAIRTINKIGIYNFIQRAKTKGTYTGMEISEKK